jgi:PAS domain S-box-containing protein
MTPSEVVAVNADPRLVVLSIAISMLGAFAAIELMAGLHDAQGRLRLPWFVGAATADGIGTWSMHYTGKLALRIPLLLDWRMVVLSLVIGIAGSAAALLLAGRKNAKSWRILRAGLLLGGVGISGLHFTAMAAIEQPSVRHDHSHALVALSIALAVVISCLSLPLALQWTKAGQGMPLLRKCAAAFVRGSANPAMHYTAMAGVMFGPVSNAAQSGDTVSIESIGVIGISVVPVMVLLVALLTSALGRLEKQRTIFDLLFAQSPAAVAVMRDDAEIVRVNREFSALFGYEAAESLGRKIDVLIGLRGATAEPLANAKEGRVPFEGLATRKDGTRVDIAGVRVPVLMPDASVEIYALMRDVTDQKRAADALRAYPQRLIETQEVEGLRIARELHDEIGQALTGVSMLLSVDANLPEETQERLAEARSVLHDLTGRVRNLAVDLRPPMLDDLGLIHTLENLFQRYERQTGIHVAFERDEANGERRFGAEIEIAAYRIVQEALTNVARHAGVREVAVDLLTDDEFLRIEIVDRGRGFERAAVERSALGLIGMEERTHLAGGELTIASSPGVGARIEAVLPLRRTDQEPPG